MANYDNPNGFEVLTPCCGTNTYTLGGTVTKGDLLRLEADGTATLYDISTDIEALGIAGTAGVSGDVISVYDSPDIEIVGQCSGTFATTQIGDRVDVEGTTGIQEVNENASVVGVLKILRHYPVTGSMDVGANSRVVCKIVRHAMSAEQTSGAGTFDSLTATGAVTGATLEIGGGYGSTGLSVAATGNLSTNGTLTVDGASTLTGEVQVGGGYGSTGTTLSAAGNAQHNGNLTVDGTSTLTGEVQVGGGYGSTGSTFSAAGNIQANGTLTVDGASTLTGAVAVGGGYGSTGSNLDANGDIRANGNLTVDGTSTLTGAVGITAAATLSGGLMLALGDGFASTSVAGNTTLVWGTNPQFQKIDPNGGNRDVTLPAVGAGRWYWITNAADAAENLVVKNAAAATIATLNQNEAALFISSATAWDHMGVITIALT